MGNKEVVETQIFEGLSGGRSVRADVDVHGRRVRAGRVVPSVGKAMKVVRGLSHNKRTFRGGNLKGLKAGSVSGHCGIKAMVW
jgi:hypothetical protein